MLNWMNLDLLSVIMSGIAVFVAGIVRGYSGFGFAMVAVTSITPNNARHKDSNA